MAAPADLTPLTYTAPRAITPPRPGGTNEQIHKAAQDFEAVFISQMLQPMFETVEVDGLFGGGSAEETWRTLQVEEYGKLIARQGGIGLAPVVERELLKLQEGGGSSHGTGATA